MATFFSNNIVILRERKDLTQHEAATALGLKRSSFANYESGATEPKFEILERFVLFYGINAHDLLFTDITKGNLTTGTLEEEKGNLKGNPIGNLNTQNSTPDTYSVVIEAKDQVILSLQETINAQKELITVKNQQVMELTEENNRLKRAVPEIGQPMEDTSRVGGHSKTA